MIGTWLLHHMLPKGVRIAIIAATSHDTGKSQRWDYRHENDDHYHVWSPIRLNRIPEPSPTQTGSHSEPRLHGAEFSKRVFEAGRDELLYRVYNTSTEQYKCVLNLATLQRMNLHVLQKEIVEKVASIAENPSMIEGRDLRNLMKEYCKCNFFSCLVEDLLSRRYLNILTSILHGLGETLRDWDLMQAKWTPDFEKDPFKLVTSKALDKKIIEEARIALPIGRGLLQDPYDFYSPQLPGGSRGHVIQEKKTQLIAKRFGVALAGELALLAPVIIMAVRKTLLKSLLTVSVAVLLFCVAIAKFSHQSSVEILSLTAAYTAVLVVFVGVS